MGVTCIAQIIRLAGFICNSKLLFRSRGNYRSKIYRCISELTLLLPDYNKECDCMFDSVIYNMMTSAKHLIRIVLCRTVHVVYFHIYFKFKVKTVSGKQSAVAINIKLIGRWIPTLMELVKCTFIPLYPWTFKRAVGTGEVKMESLMGSKQLPIAYHL